MNIRVKTVLSLSLALPAMALATFLLIQPQNLVAEDMATCTYNNAVYSLGATISGSCPSGQVQTCAAQDYWTPCSKPTGVVPVESSQ